MKFLLASVLLVVAFAAVQSASLGGHEHVSTLLEYYQNTKGNRIVGGSPSTVGQFPWQVAIYITRSGGTSFCGGALISPTWVLTAAHCAQGGTSFRMYFGGITLSSSETGRVEQTSTSSIIHSGYNSNLNNDVAVIRLSSAVPINSRIQVIRLPTRGSVVGTNVQVTVSGWGRTSDNSGVSNTMNFVQLRSIDNPECAGIYGNQVIIASTICARGNPHHSTCQGDSGGPLVTISGGVATHIGVVSFVSAAGCASGNPSGYVRTEAMLSWIQTNTGVTYDQE